jgi:hypothetical protein
MGSTTLTPMLSSLNSHPSKPSLPLLPGMTDISAFYFLNACLNAPLKEDIFLEQPPGFEDEKGVYVVLKLQKALHGLKQARRSWYAVLCR